MEVVPDPREGEVWDIDLDSPIGREQGGRRPAVIISNNHFNLAPNGLYIIAPIMGRDRGIRLHVKIEPPEGGLVKASVIMCDQARSVSILRCKRRRGTVSPETLAVARAFVASCIDR